MIKINSKYKVLGARNIRYFIITGGRGSGKSFSVNTAITALVSGEENHKVLFTRYTLTAAEKSIIPEFIEKIEITNTQNEFDVKAKSITNKVTGSDILFEGIKTSSGNQTAKLKSLQGVTTWVLDEAEELEDEKVFDDIDLSIRQKGIQNRVIIVMNPSTKEHFIYKRFFEQMGVNEGFNGVVGNVAYIHTTYLDNIENLSQSFIDNVELMKARRPEKYKHQIMGAWLSRAEGVIFENWEIGKFEEVGQKIFGQDYGFSIDPTTLIEINVDKNNMAIYVKECYYKSGMATSEIADLNKKYAGKQLIIGDSAEPRLISELQKLGNNIRGAEKGQGSITAGISMLQDYNIIVDTNSINLIKEFNNYAWSDKKSSTPIDNWNHGIDPLRYGLFYTHKRVFQFSINGETV